jgi:hypothetical protein
LGVRESEQAKRCRGVGPRAGVAQRVCVEVVCWGEGGEEEEKEEGEEGEEGRWHRPWTWKGLLERVFSKP